MLHLRQTAMVRAGAEVYQLGSRLVRPVSIEVDASDERKTKIAVLVGIDQAYLKTEMTRFIDFFKWKKEVREGSGPPSDVVGAVLSRYGKWKFLKVTGIIASPTLRRDGTLLATVGLDAQTGLLVVGPLPQMEPLGTTREDAVRAAKILDDELLVGFPWVDGPSRSVALSGLIVPAVRSLLDCVPLHGASAPTAGTGKSYLWDTSAAISIGNIMPIIAAGTDKGKIVDDLTLEADYDGHRKINTWLVKSV